MKKNNKGYTLVEVIVSFALIMVVMIYLLRTIVVLVNKNNDVLVSQEYSVYENNLLSDIYKDIDASDLESISTTITDNSIRFTDINKVLEFNKEDKEIIYDNVVYKLPDGYDFDDTIFTQSCDNSDTKYCVIKINLIENGNKTNIKIVYQKKVDPNSNFVITFYDRGIVATQFKRYNDSLDSVTPKGKEYHTFKYWSTSETGSSYDTTQKVTGDLTLYAVYERNRHTVTFKDGETTLSQTTIDEGTKVIKPTNPTKVDYVFENWYLGDRIYDFNNLVVNDLVINAKFKPILCKRATTLHTELCTNTDSHYCKGAGHSSNEKIYYGSLGTNDGALNVGDAVVCDLNNDKTFDDEEEKFYYVSDRYISGGYNNATYDNNTAVLVYYSNTTGGIASTDNVAYDTTNVNNRGPVTAKAELPTTSQWSNMNLINENRQIYTETGTTSTTGGDLPIFGYTDLAARLLTYHEVYNGCYDGTHSINSASGVLNKCEFLFERTKYTNSTYDTYGSWLETPVATGGVGVWYSLSYTRSINYGNVIGQNAAGTDSYTGARPAIEVEKLQIDKTIRSHLVKYNANGGTTSVEEQYITIGDALEDIPTATRKGYTFDGWYTGIDTGIRVDNTYVPTANMTLYARWSPVIICRRASTLNNEVCTNDDPDNYCQGTGHALNEKIYYGNLGTDSTTLNTGDAFDCKTDENGDYTERFYYVSDKYVSRAYTSATYDTDKAVLVYYSNTTGGVASTSNVAYDSTNVNNRGPVTAVADLPTTTQWNNMPYTDLSRQIYSETGATSTSAGNLPVFNYTGYAARLLTLGEIQRGCYDGSHAITSSLGLQYKCEYLFERTKYTNNSYTTYGTWFETPDSNDGVKTWLANGYERNIYSGKSYASGYFGARPAIELDKGQIDKTIRSYMVKYDPNGGTLTDDVQFISIGNSLSTLPTPTREGYNFEGWYTEISTGVQVTTSYIPTGNITLYARWLPKYTVTFDKNASNATGTMSNQVFVQSKSQKLTKNAFVRSGYVFKNWNTKANGTGTSYSDEQQVVDISTTDITLYAQWVTASATFDTYMVFKEKLQNLLGNSWYTVSKYFRQATSIPAAYKTDNYKVSTSNSTVPIYLYYSSNVVYFYCVDSAGNVVKPSFNPDSNHFFSGMPLIGIDLDKIDSSKITNARGMFDSAGASNSSINWSYFNPSNITDMTIMFQSSKFGALDLSSWGTKTSKVKSFDNIFHWAEATSISTRGWSLAAVNNAYDVANMFAGNPNVTTIDISRWTLPSGRFQNTFGMFAGCPKLTTIYSTSDLYPNKITITQNDPYCAAMFAGSTKLRGGNGTTYKTSNTAYDSGLYARVDAGGSPGYFTYKN